MNDEIDEQSEKGGDLLVVLWETRDLDQFSPAND